MQCHSSSNHTSCNAVIILCAMLLVYAMCWLQFISNRIEADSEIICIDYSYYRKVIIVNID